MDGSNRVTLNIRRFLRKIDPVTDIPGYPILQPLQYLSISINGVSMNNAPKKMEVEETDRDESVEERIDTEEDED